MNHRNTPPTLPKAPSPWRSTAKTAWLLMALAGTFAIIPGVGFLAWIVGPPLLFIVFIQGIIVMSRGGAGEGSAILLAAIIGMPIWLFTAPVVVGALTIDTTDLHEVLDYPATEFIITK